jgi:hypothetical protein
VKKKAKIMMIFLLLGVLVNSLLFLTSRQIQSFDPDSYVILSAYEYHIVSVNATIGHALSGDWDVMPADVLSPPFLVFIIDSESLVDWENSDNLTKAINRIPAERLLYLYDPFFRLDDIIGDSRRSDSFNVKVPFEDTWHLVMYAGATAISLTFSWHINAVDANLLNIILYSIFGTIALAVFITTAIIYFRRKKVQTEDEIEQLLKKQEYTRENESRRSLGSLEIDEEDMYEEIIREREDQEAKK